MFQVRRGGWRLEAGEAWKLVATERALAERISGELRARGRTQHESIVPLDALARLSRGRVTVVHPSDTDTGPRRMWVVP